MVILLGLVLAFLVAGLIEGFVTGHVANVGVRVGLGVFVWLGFGTWIIWGGIRASARGYTGKIGENEKPSFARL